MNDSNSLAHSYEVKKLYGKIIIINKLIMKLF